MGCYNRACILSDGSISGCTHKQPEGIDNCEKAVTEPPLEYGDEIEVQGLDDEKWHKRIFVKLESGLAFCHSVDIHDVVLLELCGWQQWRRPSPSLTWEDRDKLRDKWVRRKIYAPETEIKITNMFLSEGSVPYIRGLGTFEELQRNWEFLDGTPII